VTLAVLCTIFLRSSGYPTTLAFFYGAVLATAWLGGFLPALVATALSASVNGFFLLPFLSLSGLDPYNTGRLLIFVVLSFLVCCFGATRARSQAAHRASEKHYRMLFDRSLAGVFLSTLNGQLLNCNESFAKLLGYDSREEILTHPAADFYFDSAHRESYIEKLQKEGSVTTYEVCIRGKHGRPIWIVENVSLIEDDDGALNLLQGTMIDITERKRAEEAQRKSQQKYESLVESIDGIVWEVDASSFTFTFVSKEAERILGYPVEQWLNSPTFWKEHLHPDDCDWAVEFCLDAVKKRADHRFEYRMIAADGHMVWLSDIVTIHVVDGSVLLRGVMVDISERKRVELALDERLKFETLLTRLSAAFANISAPEVDGEINLWLKTLADFLDVDRATFMLMGEDAKTLYRSHTHAAPGIEPLELAAINDKFPWISEQLLLGQTVKFSHGPQDMPEKAVLEREFALRMGVKSALNIPVLIDGSFICAIAFTSLRHFREWPDEVVARLRMVGEIFASAVARKRGQEALSEAERKFHDIFEHAVEGIFRTTPDGRFVTANPALARMLGYDSPDELMQEPGDFARRLYVDPQRREEFKALMGLHRFVKDFQFQVRRKDQTEIWISENVRTVCDERGEILYYEGTAEDITERRRIQMALRESEERYRELFENAHDAIYVHDLKGNYISVNRAAEKLSGFTRAEIVGKNFSEFVSPKHLKEIRARLREKLIGEDHTAFELEIIAKDGHRVDVEVNARLIFENGIAIAVQGMARDISDRKRAEEALRGLPRRLIDAQEAERRRVARELHDEIGQALTAIKINLHGIQQSTENEPFAPQLNGSLDIIDRALQQVRELALDLRPALLDDLGLVAALRWYLDREARRAGLILELKVDLLGTRLAPEIETACFRIAQEALTNIVRHAKAKHVWVILSLRDADLRLVIRDDGVGFDVGAAQQRFAANASLGLQGMQERALAVSGTISIDSSKGTGAEVRVNLPFLLTSSSNTED
jgi:PAS domain S-box-containing protein